MASSLMKNLPVKIRSVGLINRYASYSLKEKATSEIAETNAHVAYPPIKPKYPEGEWGKLDHKYAWQWQDLKEKFLQISSIQERMHALLNNENIAMLKPVNRDWAVHNFDERITALTNEASTFMELLPINDHPETLQFRKYVTKTLLLPRKDFQPAALTNFHINDMDNLMLELRQHITDHFLMEFESRHEKDNMDSKKFNIQLLFRSVSDFLTAKLGNQLSYLKSSQYDEKVFVRSIWSRYGFEKKKRIYIHDPDVYRYETVNDQHMAFQNVFDAMLKSDLPLPEFAPRDAYLTTNSESPKLRYKYQIYGQEKPLVKRKPKSILAGHKLGNPCEFGLVGMLNTLDTTRLEKDLSPKVAKDCRLALGITSVFGWLVAQACYQGFSHIVDVTYPLTSQLILSDGRNFSFLAYQLNTLQLWKDDVGNKLLNVCWSTEEMPLYHSIENGKVRELNDDVLKQLIQTFTVPAADRGYNMKPTVPAENLLPTKDFIPKKIYVPPVVEEEKYIIE